MDQREEDGHVYIRLSKRYFRVPLRDEWVCVTAPQWFKDLNKYIYLVNNTLKSVPKITTEFAGTEAVHKRLHRLFGVSVLTISGWWPLHHEIKTVADTVNMLVDAGLATVVPTTVRALVEGDKSSYYLSVVNRDGSKIVPSGALVCSPTWVENINNHIEEVNRILQQQ